MSVLILHELKCVNIQCKITIQVQHMCINVSHDDDVIQNLMRLSNTCYMLLT
jgi:hypothetical protein